MATIDPTPWLERQQAAADKVTANRVVLADHAMGWRLPSLEEDLRNIAYAEGEHQVATAMAKAVQEDGVTVVDLHAHLISALDNLGAETFEIDRVRGRNRAARTVLLHLYQIKEG